MFKAMYERAIAEVNNAPLPAAAPHRPTVAVSPVVREAARTVGRSNPALVDLLHLRRHLSPLQNALVDSVECFYEDSAVPKTNRQLACRENTEAAGNMSADHERTLARRASFLLNSDAMDGLRPLLANLEPDAGMLGQSMTAMTVNAVASSVKSQAEHVKAVALAQAQAGERICPMTLQPLNFQRMLEENTARLAQLAGACHLPVAPREAALKPLLEELATSYFQHSRHSPGAPKSAPHKVVIHMSDPGRSHVDANFVGKKIAHVAIDSAGIDRLCNGPLPPVDDCEDRKTIFRTHLLQGFQNHSPETKRAVLYLQLLWSEVGALQETLGVRSLDKPHHGAAAQCAAARTLEEKSYRGNHDLGDQIGCENDVHAQRRTIVHGMETLPDVDFSFKEQFGSSMLTDPRLRDWTQSTAYSFDLRMLRDPGSRLLLQSIPITADALLKTSVLRTPV